MQTRTTDDTGVSGIVVDAWRVPTTTTLCLVAILVSAVGFSPVGVAPFVVDRRAFGPEPWRLVSAHLAHGDLFHLGINLYWTWIFGQLLEPRLGHFRFAGLLVALAVGISAACHAFDEGGIGLSGIGYGLWGFLLVAGRRLESWRGLLHRREHVLFVLWFALCIVMTREGVWNISNWGHGSGAVLGATFAWAWEPARRFSRKKVAASAMLLLGLLGCATLWRERLNFGGGAASELRLAYEAMQREAWDEARADYDRAVRLAPRDSTAWWGLGSAQNRLGLAKESVASCYRAFELGVRDAQFLEALAAALAIQARTEHEAGRKVAALDCVRKAAEVTPNEVRARKDVEWFANDTNSSEWVERARRELERLAR